MRAEAITYCHLFTPTRASQTLGSALDCDAAAAAHPVSGISDRQISDTFTFVGYYGPTTDVASYEAKH